MADETNIENPPSEPSEPTDTAAAPADPNAPSDGTSSETDQTPPDEPIDSAPTDPESPPASEPEAPAPVAAAPAPISPAPTVNQTLDTKFTANALNWKQHLTEALASRKNKQQQRLLTIMTLAEKNHGKITNLQVQKAFGCTQLTAWRYLSILVRQSKLRRIGGHNTPTYEMIR